MILRLLNSVLLNLDFLDERRGREKRGSINSVNFIVIDCMSKVWSGGF